MHFSTRTIKHKDIEQMLQENTTVNYHNKIKVPLKSKYKNIVIKSANAKKYKTKNNSFMQIKQMKNHKTVFIKALIKKTQLIFLELICVRKAIV